MGPLGFYIRTKGGTETAEFMGLAVAKADLPELEKLRLKIEEEEEKKRVAGSTNAQPTRP